MTVRVFPSRNNFTAHDSGSGICARCIQRLGRKNGELINESVAATCGI
jgi:hypothetical protein